MSTATSPITNPIAHGLRGRHPSLASLPSYPSDLVRWMEDYATAKADGIRINDTEGYDALLRAVADEEEATRLEANLSAATEALAAGQARLRALEAARHALVAVPTAAAGLAPEDAALLCRLDVWVYAARMASRIVDVMAEVRRLEHAEVDAQQALREYEDAPE